MSVLRGFALMGLIVCCASVAWGESLVVVDSKTVCAGTKNVTVAIKITNDVELRHVEVPLEMRSVSGGATATALKMSWGDRMPLGHGTPLGDNCFSSQFREQECECGKDKHQGYGPAVAFKDTLSHPVEKLPVGMLFSRFRMMGANLKPGADKSGSFLVTLDLGSKPGTIEIDTTCVCPSHTLMFVDVSRHPRGVFPKFTKGVLTVEACADKK